MSSCLTSGDLCLTTDLSDAELCGEGHRQHDGVKDVVLLLHCLGHLWRTTNQTPESARHPPGLRVRLYTHHVTIEETLWLDRTFTAWSLLQYS